MQQTEGTDKHSGLLKHGRADVKVKEVKFDKICCSHDTPDLGIDPNPPNKPPFWDRTYGAVRHSFTFGTFVVGRLNSAVDANGKNIYISLDAKEPFGCDKQLSFCYVSIVCHPILCRVDADEIITQDRQNIYLCLSARNRQHMQNTMKPATFVYNNSL